MLFELIEHIHKILAGRQAARPSDLMRGSCYVAQDCTVSSSFRLRRADVPRCFRMEAVAVAALSIADLHPW